MAYIKSHRNQNYLLPQNITDLFSEDHVCYLIEQITDDLDYSAFDNRYAGAGHPAYHPRIILKLLLMANVDGIRSSRKIAKNASENVVYIYLSEKTSPDFRTISDFRKDNKELLKQVSLQLNKFALEHGLIDLSHIITDGTVIKANANDMKNIDKETLEKLGKYIEELIEEGIKVDEEEDKLYGDRGLHQLPKDLNNNEKRKPVVKKIVEEINKAVKENNEEKTEKIKQEINQVKEFMDQRGIKKYSPIDPDSRFMRNKKSRKELSYNGQITVDKNGIILDDSVVQEADDRHQLLPNINSVEKGFGKLSKGTKVSADAGYESAKDMQKLADRKFDLYVPGKNLNSDKKFVKANFDYDEDKDCYICPAGQMLISRGEYFNKNRGEYLKIYKAHDCNSCPYKDQCCKNAKQRVIHALPEDKLLNQIKVKLRTEEGRKIFRQRRETVEICFGDIKYNRNFRSFLLRGVGKVEVEFKLACLAHNFVRINNMIHKPPDSLVR